MKCPFLKETRVKFCQVSPIKKMIVSDQGDSETEKCSTSSWTSCPVAQKRIRDGEEYRQCPFLQESFVQYCSLSAITKFIPYNEAPFSRCSNTNHRYCEHYLSMENPDSFTSMEHNSVGEEESNDSSKDYRVEGIRMPKKLRYSPNHMWIDESEDGLCHIGVDAFLTSVIGQVESISFVTTKGVNRPTVVLTTRGVDLEVVFPGQILITGMNSYLRATPDKLTNDPYGTGWLFVGQKPKHVEKDVPLLHGNEVLEWIKCETERLSQFVHRELQNFKLEGKVLMADGGRYSDTFSSLLTRDELLKLFYNFFSPYVKWRN